jgi:siroheme synthase
MTRPPEKAMSQMEGPTEQVRLVSGAIVSFNRGMGRFLMTLRLLVVFTVVAGLTGCASSPATSDDDWTPEPVPSHDDSHGWGATVQNAH